MAEARQFMQRRLDALKVLTDKLLTERSEMRAELEKTKMLRRQAIDVIIKDHARRPTGPCQCAVCREVGMEEFKGKAHPNTDYPDMSDETVAAEHSSLGVIDLTPQRPSPAEPADADDFPEEAWKEWTEDPCPLDEVWGTREIAVIAARWAWTEALLYSDRRLPVWVDELAAERDAALERVKELERRNYTLSDDKDEAETQLADAWYSFEPAFSGADPEAGMDSADWWDLMKATRDVLAKHAKGGG